MAESKKAAGVTVRSDTVRMKFPTEKQTKECRAVTVGDTIYERETNGTFIVQREHVPAMRNQGLDLAE